MIENDEYDKLKLLKRAHAFEHVIFPSCARRVILQRKYGYGNLIPGTINPVIKIFAVYIRKARKAEHAKAYYVAMVAFMKFLQIIEYPINFHEYESLYESDIITTNNT